MVLSFSVLFSFQNSKWGGKCIECNAESSFCQEDVQKLSEKFQKTHFSLMLPLMSHENQVESQASLQFGSVNC